MSARSAQVGPCLSHQSVLETLRIYLLGYNIV